MGWGVRSLTHRHIQQTGQVDTINVFVKWGVCVPRECGIEDVKTAIFPPITEKLADRSKGVCGPLKPGATLFVSAQPLSPAAASTLAFLALLLLAVLAATVVDVYGPRRRTRPRFFDGTTAAASTVSSHSSGSSSGSTSHGSSSSSHGSSSSSSAPILTAALVQSFSLSRNYDRLAAPPRPGPFLCLEAVRVLAMGQVILGHTLWFLIHVSGIGNPREMLGYQNRGLLSTGVGLIANSSLYGVDAFFAIAGFLAVLLFMEELHKVSRWQ